MENTLRFNSDTSIVFSIGAPPLFINRVLKCQADSFCKSHPMKYLLLLVFNLLFAVATFSQKTDTVTYYQFGNNAWQPSLRNINSYNSSCFIDSTLQQNWDTHSFTWQNTGLIIFTYTNDVLSQEVGQAWVSGWVNSFRITNTYNINNQEILSLTENWDISSNSWIPSDRTTNFYNADNLLDSTLTEVNSSGSWQNSTLNINHYNADGFTDTITNQGWNTIAWLNSSRTIYTYNTDQTVSQTVHQSWDLATPAWSNQSRDAQTYGASKQQLTDTAQTWNGQWNNSTLIINTYTGNMLTNYLQLKWDSSALAWINNFQLIFTFNDNGTNAETIAQNWDTGTNIWVNGTKVTFSYSTSYNTSCILPLTLLSFTASFNGKAALLQWTTATEMNTKNFVIQRSIDGRMFSGIGTVKAIGNSIQKTAYQFADADAIHAGANKVYYRLQMVDNDGKFTYSGIAIVKIVNSNLFVIYPNPVKDQLFITSNISLSNVQLRISDQSGKIVYKQQITTMDAGTPDKVNITNLSKGVYYLQLITNDKVPTTKFLKY